MGHVAQPKGDRIKLETAVGKRQLLGIGGKPLQTKENALVERPRTANLEHSLIDIADYGAALGGDAGLRYQARQRPQGDIAGAAGNVEQSLTRAWL